ncbi:MAG: hypothetical protein ACR2KP_07210, partial [Egibacteraceae bacterium]
MLRTVGIRAAPEWVPERVAAEPVRKNLPGDKSASTRRLTASHTGGTRCHSSMSTGGSPSRVASASASAIVDPARHSVGGDWMQALV